MYGNVPRHRRGSGKNPQQSGGAGNKVLPRLLTTLRITDVLIATFVEARDIETELRTRWAPITLHFRSQSSVPLEKHSLAPLRFGARAVDVR